MDTTQVGKPLTVAVKTAIQPESSAYWMYIAIGLMVIVIILLILLIITRIKQRPLTEKEILKQQLRSSGSIDFSNTIKSAFHSKALYDQLKVKCHPDRFVGNDDLVVKATEISQLINENKTNFSVLEELKTRANAELNIKF